ncbi:MAG: hypothetical protein LBB49_05395 [Gracilibacteraceae bacterium]|nr:hypothetical protein [Gracilibacteraceae bacterium]
MPYDDMTIPELLPPYEDGIFKTLLTQPDAKPILRDVVAKQSDQEAGRNHDRRRTLECVLRVWIQPKIQGTVE